MRNRKREYQYAHFRSVCSSLHLPFEVGGGCPRYDANLSILFLGSFDNGIDGQEPNIEFYFLDSIRDLLSFWF